VRFAGARVRGAPRFSSRVLVDFGCSPVVRERRQLGQGARSPRRPGPERASADATVQLTRCERPIGTARQTLFPIIANSAEGTP